MTRSITPSQYTQGHRNNRANIGDFKGGSRFSLGDDETVKGGIVENELVHGVFRSHKQVVDVLKELKEADLGVCVTVSGLIHRVGSCCQQTGLTLPYTSVSSLGIWGDVKLLLKKQVQEIATMCDHVLVSFNLVVELAGRVSRVSVRTPLPSRLVRCLRIRVFVGCSIRLELLIKEFID